MTADDIKAMRHAKQWRVADLAKLCGVSPRTIEGWEQGRAIRPAMVAVLRNMRSVKKSLANKKHDANGNE